MNLHMYVLKRREMFYQSGKSLRNGNVMYCVAASGVPSFIGKAVSGVISGSE